MVVLLEMGIYCKLRKILKEVKLIGVVKSEGSGARLCEFESWFYLLTAV